VVVRFADGEAAALLLRHRVFSLLYGKGLLSEERALRRRWAELLRRIDEVEPLLCPRCGETMRIVALITEPRVITRILRHLATKGAGPRSPPQASPAAA
jgi:hypothetical protein